MLKAIFLGDPSVNATKQTVMGDTQAELQAEVERLSAQMGVNPQNWYGDGYKDVSGIPADAGNDWARTVFDISNDTGPTTWEGVFEEITGRKPTPEDLKLKEQLRDRGQIDNWWKEQKATPTPTGEKTTEPTGDTDFEPVTPENQVNPTQVQEVYREYTGRDATPEEVRWHTESHPISYDDLVNWGKTAPEAQRELDKNVTQKEQGLTDALAMIDQAVSDGLLDPDTARMYKRVVNDYEGEEVKVQEILDTFKKIKEETIDPYFKELVDVSQEELRANVESLRGQRERQIESTQLGQQEEIRGTKAGLESRGMLYSGEAVRELGKLSPYNTTQTKGRIPSKHDIISTSQTAGYQEQLQGLARESEMLYGSVPTDIFKPGEYTPMGVDVTAKMPLAQEGTEAGVLGQLIGTSTDKEERLGPIDYNFSNYELK